MQARRTPIILIIVLELAKLAQVVSSPSRLRIVEELMRGPQTAAALAKKLSLSTVTVHHHLPWLERAGVIEQAPPVRSGKAGRPTNRFRLSASPLQINLPPRDFQSLATLLAGVLSSTLSKKQLGEVANSVGTDLGKKLGAAILQQSGSDRLSISGFRRHVVEGHCAQHGFAPEVVDEKPRSIHFRLHNCLVLEVAREHPDFVCELDVPMMESLARTTLGNAEVELKGCMGHGSPCCEFVVRRRK